MAQHTAPITARIPVWSPGTYRSLSGDEFTFTDGDLAAIAAGYSPGLFAAPVVKGHPKTDDPAQGWVDTLEWDGQILWGDASRIDPAFADEHRAGRYRKVSPRFFMPDEPGNPTPGGYYLRHVGFLGAAAPANKALPLADFADGEGAGLFADQPDLPEAAFAEGAPRWGFRAMADWARKLREYFIARDGIEAADRAVPEYLVNDLVSAGSEPPEPDEPVAGFTDPITEPQEEPVMDPSEEQQAAFAEQQAQLQREREQLAAERQALADQVGQARRQSCAAFAEELADQGRILPAEQPFVAALLADIPADAECSFAEGDGEVTVATGERLRQFLSALPPRVDYREHGAGDPGEQVAAFAAPAGYSVDPAAAELHRKAKAHQAEHSITFEAALAAVSR